ncbi:hypothetical protein TNIN_435091 [Trichonephila inaurata madagascariensis]|uniref:Uncharacterized protein n=1 Tax=Trichonephila inaurata madagascariensis TaxID=2747483 RepID=A0A8X6XFR9_9ARAC|nr:hypothetical protein TNIN_435091 [Trichonephila inaurata madagascariensis]
MRKTYVKPLEEIKSKKRRNAICKISDFARSITVAAFRMETGHDCFDDTGIYNSPLCLLCKQRFEIDNDHLSNCSSLNEESLYSLYWRVRELTSSD